MNDFIDLRKKLSILWDTHSLKDSLLVDIYQLLDKIETKNSEKDLHIHRLKSTLNNFPNPIFEEDFTGARIIVESLRADGVTDVERYLREHPEIVEEIAQSVSITEVNYAALELYGFESFEEFYRDLSFLIGRESYGDFIKQFLAIIDGADHFEQEMQNTNELEELEHLIITLSVIERDQYGISRVLSTVQDISELKRVQKQQVVLEDRLAQAKQFEVLGKLAGGVAHDLNNVLVGLVSYPDMLMFGMSDNDPMKEPLKTIKEAGDDATGIVQDLLTMSRRSANVYEPVDMNHLIDTVCSSDVIGNHLDEKPQVTLELDLEEELPLISGSLSHLRKMLSNLVINAIEAQVSKGTVTISTTRKLVDASSQQQLDILSGPYILISVTDHGKGMREDEIAQIFEPFYSKKSLGYKVSGIGMTVVKGVVEEHQGSISVESRLDEGSSFRIYLPAPLDISMKEISDEKLNEEIMGHGESILVVDDMDLQRSITMKTLERLGYEVKGSTSGEEAMQLFSEGIAPDLVILDMIMPGMDGLETCINLLKLNPRQRIVMLSGFAESVRVNEALEKGALGFIHKPYTVKKIGYEIADFLKRDTGAK